MIDIKDLQERALDHQYFSEMWGDDWISKTIHAFMMDFASGCDKPQVWAVIKRRIS